MQKEICNVLSFDSAEKLFLSSTKLPYNRIDGIVCVNNSIQRYLTEHFSESLWINSSQKTLCKINEFWGIEGLYRGMGVDRICNLVGALELFPRQNIVVIDLGTHTTITELTFSPKDHKYKLALNYIILGLSEQLKQIKLPEAIKVYDDLLKDDLTKSINPTYNAILSGLFDCIRRQVISFANSGVRVILTGGWSKSAAKILSFNVHVDQNLGIWGANSMLQNKI